MGEMTASARSHTCLSAMTSDDRRKSSPRSTSMGVAKGIGTVARNAESGFSTTCVTQEAA